MDVLRNEICKLLSKKAVRIVLFLIIINSLILLYIINTRNEDGYSVKDYSGLYKEISTLDEDNILKGLEKGINDAEDFGGMNLYSRVYSEVKAVLTYNEFLDDIDGKAGDIAIMNRIFRDGNYAARNAEKTREVFKKLKGIRPTVKDPSGILCITDSNMTDYILILMIFIIAVNIVFLEKNHNQFQLLRTMEKGRKSLMSSKIIVMIISVALITIFLYGTNFLIAVANFGAPDLNIPIQSLYLYRCSPFAFNVGEFLISYLTVKILSSILVGMLFLVICAAFDQIIYVFTTGAALVFTEAFLSIKIPATHYLSLLKFLNIMYGVETGDIFSDYININVIGYPVNTCLIYAVMWLVLISLSVLYIINDLNMPGEKGQVSFGRLKIKKISGEHTSIFFHECYKMMITERVLLTLVIFSVFVMWWNPAMNIQFDSVDEIYYKEYMDELYGPLDSKTHDKLNEEKQKYEDLSNKIAADIEQGKSDDYINIKYKDELSRSNAFDKVMSHLEYLESEGGGWLFFDKGYDILTDTGYLGNRDISQAFIYIIILIAMTCGIYGIDYSNSEMSILRSTTHGRGRLNVIKGVLGISSTIISFILIYIVRLMNVFQAYGMGGLHAPASSMEHLSGISQDISVLQYLIIIMGMRFIGGVIIVFTVFILTERLKNSVFVIALCSIIFILPLLLVLFHVPNAQYFLLNPLLIGNVF